MDARTRGWVGTGLRVSLAHHPLCTVFAHDVVRVRGVRICSGCAAAIPLFLLGFMGAIVGAGLLPPLGWLGLGLLLGVPHLTTYLRRWGRRARFAAKALGGAGLGLVLAALLAGPLPAALRIALLAAMALAFVALQALRMRSIWKACRACPWGARWEVCPGFSPAFQGSDTLMR